MRLSGFQLDNCERRTTIYDQPLRGATGLLNFIELCGANCMSHASIIISLLTFLQWLLGLGLRFNNYFVHFLFLH